MSMREIFEVPGFNVNIFLWHRDDGTSVEARLRRIQTNEAIDLKYGYARHKEPVDRLGWLINMHPVRASFDERGVHQRNLCCTLSTLKVAQGLLEYFICG